MTLALVVFARDTGDGVLLLFEGELVGSLLPLLGHGLDGSTTCRSVKEDRRWNRRVQRKGNWYKHVRKSTGSIGLKQEQTYRWRA